MVGSKQSRNTGKITSDAEYATLETFTYTTEENNKANLDLNQLYQEDYLSMVGLLGKRSQNLLASISDKKAAEQNSVILSTCPVM